MLFDLHCDTAFELYKRKQSLYCGSTAVNLEKYSIFEKKAQVFAVWSDRSYTDDECYLSFQHIANELRSQIEENSEYVRLCTSKEDLEMCNEDGKLAAIIAAEDARLLSGDLSRLEKLYEHGVRVITLGWQGTSCVCGSFDTEDGLTDFGFDVLKECENLGITVDVSHLSEKSFWDVAGKATKPFIASHSNSYLLCDHRRNLTDVQIRTIAASGGICGNSLVAAHLSKGLEGYATKDPSTVMNAICSHVEHFSNVAPENTCLGLDFDGTAPLEGLESVDKLPLLFEALTIRGMDEKQAQNIFYNNAYNFFLKNL
ncbi:MAG: hypothetical protein E7600_07870 [Ruminococcaceae bacterium]|nr:hypothetical protein [Oscillospiraceae bacterium]